MVSGVHGTIEAKGDCMIHPRAMRWRFCSHCLKVEGAN
jgi:hypothetical protein